MQAMPPGSATRSRGGGCIGMGRRGSFRRSAIWTASIAWRRCCLIMITASCGRALIPVAVVRTRAKHQAHTNSHLFLLQDSVWDEPGVEDVTGQIARAFRELG